MPVTSITPYSVPKANKNFSTRERNQEQSANSVSFGSSSSLNGGTMRKASLAMAAMGAALIALSGCTGGSSSPNSIDPDPADPTELSSSSSDTTAIELPSSSSVTDTTKSSSSSDTTVTDTTKSSSSVADTSKSSSSVADTTKSSSSAANSSSSVSGTSSSSSTTATSSSSVAAAEQTEVQKTLQEFIDFLGLEGTSSAKALTKVAAAIGDVNQINYTDMDSKKSYELVYNSNASTEDTTVFDYKSTNIYTGVTASGIRSFSKSSNGLVFKDSNLSNSYEYVISDGYLMKYSIASDGTKAAVRRVYPGATSSSLKVTGAAGTNATDITDVNIVYQ